MSNWWLEQDHDDSWIQKQSEEEEQQVMEPFVYDKDDSYQNNFDRWWYMNSLERECWNEPKLDKTAAEKMFRELFPRFRYFGLGSLTDT